MSEDEKGLFQKIADYIKEALDWLLSDEDKDGIPLIVEIATTIIKIIGMFNPVELTDSEKQLVARAIMDYYKHSSVEELERAVEIKRTGALDNIQSPTLDLVIGDATARYLVKQYRKKGRKSGKTA